MTDDNNTFHRLIVAAINAADEAVRVLKATSVDERPAKMADLAAEFERVTQGFETQMADVVPAAIVCAWTKEMRAMFCRRANLGLSVDGSVSRPN